MVVSWIIVWMIIVQIDAVPSSSMLYWFVAQNHWPVQERIYRRMESERMKHKAEPQACSDLNSIFSTDKTGRLEGKMKTEWSGSFRSFSKTSWLFYMSVCLGDLGGYVALIRTGNDCRVATWDKFPDRSRELSCIAGNTGIGHGGSKCFR